MMTEKEIFALEAGEDADRRVAALVMGWMPTGIYGSFFLDGKEFARDTHPEAAKFRRFHPSSDLNDCREMEAELERCSLHTRYIENLIRVMDMWPLAALPEAFFLKTAKPITCIRAALLTVCKAQEVASGNSETKCEECGGTGVITADGKTILCDCPLGDDVPLYPVEE